MFGGGEADEDEGEDEGAEPRVTLPAMPVCEHVVADYQTLRLSLKAHPMAILRPIFEAEGLLTCVQMGTIEFHG